MKIIEKQKEFYELELGRGLPRTIVTAEIQDIIKGERFFKIGEIIEFYYMDFWARDNKIKMNESESYFVTLFPVVDNKNGEKLLGIKTNNGLIKISENITLDEKNYYGFGKVPWQEFKKNISNSINMTKGE